MKAEWHLNSLQKDAEWKQNKNKPQASRNKADKQEETNQGQIVAQSRGCRYFLPQEMTCWLSFKRIPRIDLAGRFSLPQGLLLNSALA